MRAGGRSEDKLTQGFKNRACTFRDGIKKASVPPQLKLIRDMKGSVKNFQHYKKKTEKRGKYGLAAG